MKKNEDTLKLTISKGPKIKVPDLKKMTMTEITEWIIKNKLKVEFIDQYDEKIKDNKVRSSLLYDERQKQEQQQHKRGNHS